MTLMFTHKATGAWDALTTGLMRGGLRRHRLLADQHRGRGLACTSRTSRPRTRPSSWSADRDGAAAPRRRSAGRIWSRGSPRRCGRGSASSRRPASRGVDLYLSAFGPALEEFSRTGRCRRGTARVIPVAQAQGQQDLLGEPRPLRRHARGRARRRPARGEALAAGAAHHDRPPRRAGPADRVVRAGLGRLRGAGVPLRRSAAPRARRGRRPRRRRRRQLAKKKGSDLVMLDAAARQAAHVLGPARSDGR